MQEISKDVTGFPGYKVTPSGVVYGKTGRKLWQQLNIDGYPVVYMRDTTGKQHCKRVHRLVALEFVPNPDPENLPIVNHLDSDRTNCHYSNLEWTDFSGNVQHAMKTNEQLYKNNTNLKDDQVVMICEMIQDCYTNFEIRDSTGLSVDIIKKIRSRKTWENISENYTFPISVGKTFKHVVEWICHRLNEGMTTKQIVEMNYHSTVTVDVVKSIRQGNSYSEISKHILKETTSTTRA